MVGKVGKVRGFFNHGIHGIHGKGGGTEKVLLDDDTANRNTWIMAKIHK